MMASDGVGCEDHLEGCGSQLTHENSGVEKVVIRELEQWVGNGYCGANRMVSWFPLSGPNKGKDIEK